MTAKSTKPKPLTAPQRRAAVLLAEDELTEDKIAAEVGVSIRTLYDWKQRPDMQDAMAAHAQKVQAGMSRLAIAKRHKRVAVLDELHGKLLAIIEARANDPDIAALPGGETGLIVRQLKQVRHVYEKDPDDPSSKPAQVTVEMWEAALDTGLLKEIRALEDQAATELGQKIEKVAVNGEMMVRRYIEVSPEDV